ncbi:glycogen debranching enzyme, partial [Microbispora hainanensis]
RTQHGNNNAYCQDNETSWIDWSLIRQEGDLLEFVRRLAALRRAHPVFRRRRFFQGHSPGDGSRDIIWLTPSGTEMTDGDWHTGYAKSLAVYVNGDAISEPGPRGERIRDETFLLLINAHHENLTFALPGPELGAAWRPVLDTAEDDLRDDPYAEEILPAEAKVCLADRSMRVLVSTGA